MTRARTLEWSKPISPEKEAEVKRAIAEREPKGCPFACINTPDRLKLVFPVLMDFDQELRNG